MGYDSEKVRVVNLRRTLVMLSFSGLLGRQLAMTCSV